MILSKLSSLLLSLALVALFLFFIQPSTASPTSFLPSHKSGSAETLTTVEVEAYEHEGQSSLNHQIQTVTSLSPRSLSRKDLIGAWNIVFNGSEAFSPSDSITRAITDMYASLYRVIVQNGGGNSPPDVYSLTYGLLRLTFQSIGQAIPWAAIDHFLQRMHSLASAGFAGLYTVTFYVLKGLIVYSALLISLTLLPNARDGVRQLVIT